MPTSDPAPKQAIFLSYAREDLGAARRIAEGLRRAGLEVWFDENELTGGDAWDKKIRAQIAECALFVPVISRNTQARLEGYFRLEWRVAEQRSHLMAKGKRFLVPVCIDDTVEKGAEVPESFLEVHWTRLPDGAMRPALVQLVRRMTGSTDANPAGPVAAAPSEGLASASKRSGLGQTLWVALAVALVAAGVIWFLRRPPAEKSVAVLPFANMSADKDNEAWSDGLTDEIIHALTKIPGLRVPARTSSFVFKDKKEDIKKIGELLRVGIVLEGSVQKSGNRLRVTAQLINVADGYHLWSEKYDREVTDVFAIQDDIARTIASKLRLTLAPGSAKKRTDNIEAYELVLRGKFHIEKRTASDLAQAVTFLEEALAKQPDYPLAYAQLASAWLQFYYQAYRSSAEVSPKLRAAVQKALQLDETLADAHLSFATQLLYVDRDWQGAEREFRRAIELEPSMVQAHSAFSIMLGAFGRTSEAVTEVELVMKLDPMAFESRYSSGWVYLWSKNYERAQEISQMLLKASPDVFLSHYYTGQLLARMGKLNEGIAEMEVARRITPALEVLGWLGKSYGRAGRKEDARKVLEELLERSRQGFFPLMPIANCYDGLGDVEQCNVWINKAIDAREGRTIFLNVSSDDVTRANPHFGEWLKKLGLEK